MSIDTNEKNLAQTVRFIRGPLYTDHTPEDLIARNLNRFNGWSCSAGSNGLFIDWNGEVYPGTCLMKPENSYGNIETGFRLQKEWLKCSKELCHCNIEITLPKFNNTSTQLKAEQHQISIEARSQHQQIFDPDTVVPALAWDRDSKYVMWAIGRRCNYSCSYCDDNAHSKTDPFYSRETLFKTVDFLHENYARGKVMRFAFTGGEPTLHPDYLDMVKKIFALNHLIGTTSNGSRLPDYYIELMQYSTINFSVHFEFVNVDRFVKIIEKVIQEKKAKTLLNNRWIDIRFMIRPGGYAQARDLQNTLKKIPDYQKLIFSSFVPIREPNTSNMMAYEPEELRKIQEEMS